MEQRKTVTKETWQYREDLREPKRYQVFVLNDDMTTFEFVVSVMMDVFGKRGGRLADRGPDPSSRKGTRRDIHL